MLYKKDQQELFKPITQDVKAIVNKEDEVVKAIGKQTEETKVCC